jgi:hypothetical protein
MWSTPDSLPSGLVPAPVGEPSFRPPPFSFATLPGPGSGVATSSRSTYGLPIGTSDRDATCPWVPGVGSITEVGSWPCPGEAPIPSTCWTPVLRNVWTDVICNRQAAIRRTQTGSTGYRIYHRGRRFRRQVLPIPLRPSTNVHTESQVEALANMKLFRLLFEQVTPVQCLAIFLSLYLVGTKV